MTSDDRQACDKEQQANNNSHWKLLLNDEAEFANFLEGSEEEILAGQSSD